MRSANSEALRWPLSNLLLLTLVISCLSSKYSSTAILTEVPRGFPQYTLATVKTVLHLGQDRFLQNPSQFFTHHITIVTGKERVAPLSIILERQFSSRPNSRDREHVSYP